MNLKVGDWVTIYPSRNTYYWWGYGIEKYLEKHGPQMVKIIHFSTYSQEYIVDTMPISNYYHKQIFKKRQILDKIVTVKYMETPLYKVMHGENNEKS